MSRGSNDEIALKTPGLDPMSPSMNAPNLDLSAVLEDTQRVRTAFDADAAARLGLALRLLENHGQGRALAEAALALATYEWQVRRDPAWALARAETALAIVPRSDAPIAWLQLQNVVSSAHADSGELLDAIPPALAVRRLADDDPASQQERGQATTQLGWLMLQLGDREGAELHLREGATGGAAAPVRAHAMHLLAALLADRGDLEAARAWVAELGTLADQVPEVPALQACGGARLASLESNDERAVALAEEALAARALPEADRIALHRIAAEACLRMGDAATAVSLSEHGLEEVDAARGGEDHLALLAALARGWHELGEPACVHEASERMAMAAHAGLHRRRPNGLGAVLRELDAALDHARTVEVAAERQALRRSQAALQRAHERAEAAERRAQRLREKLERARDGEALRGRTGPIVHELNNVLTVIYSNTAVMRHGASGEDARTLDDVVLATRRSIDLVRSLDTVLRTPTEDPTGDIPAATEELAAHPVPRGSGECVLVVEDEDLVRSAICGPLRRAGMHVLEARNGEEGLKIFREHRDTLDAVITDLVMPRLPGGELVRIVREEAPKLPLVVMSGYRKDPALSDVLQQPTTAFLAKPFSPAQLHAAVEAALAAAQDDVLTTRR
jgi:CheY-like chemotaxis protein